MTVLRYVACLAALPCLFLAVGLLADEPSPRLSVRSMGEAMMIKLPPSRTPDTNCFAIEASGDLRRWISLGEVIEINGSGEFLDEEKPFHRKRFYRGVHHGKNVQAALNRNRKRWEKSGTPNYQFTFRWLCFCTPDYVMPVRITVRDNRIHAVVPLDGGRPLDPSTFSRYRTIDGLFDFIQEALDQKPHQLIARFDPRYGAPRRVWVDYQAALADEERGFTVSDIQLNDPAPVMITERPPASLQLDPFTLENATVQGNTLTLSIRHGGGCREHDYELFMSPGAFLESFPVQANLYLRHNANGDLCRALLYRDLTFDLTPISELYGQPGTILLNVHEYFTEEPDGRIQVRYEQ